MKKPFVDAELCIGCGQCVETCPEVFFLNDEGISNVKDPAGASEDRIQEAMDGCPASAISWLN